MKDIKLSFPYPSTSRHNLSQDVSTSMSMGLVTPIRIVKVLPGDSHRIATSYSLISNPLVKPLLQGVRMRYCRFWVPSRIYNIDQRANNSNFDPLNQPVRIGAISSVSFPAYAKKSSIGGVDAYVNEYCSNFQQSSLFDYLGLAPIESNYVLNSYNLPLDRPSLVSGVSNSFYFNAEPYLAYVDICRNYFADSANGMIGWLTKSYTVNPTFSRNYLSVCISPLRYLDQYIDNVQNSRDLIVPYSPSANFTVPQTDSPDPFVFQPSNGDNTAYSPASFDTTSFSTNDFGLAHLGLCVPLNRPDRLSRLFDTRPLTSQNATINPSEITIGNLSFLSKLQRYLTRRFFGGSRYTDVMYSIFGQKVPHVDSPVLLDVFDVEIGSELVASTNATETQNPGVLGGYFSSAGVLSTGGNRSRKRYTFNEAGYIIDLAYIMPRLNRVAFYNDFYPVSVLSGGSGWTMSQGNFTPDFNGIGWQQPAFVSKYIKMSVSDNSIVGSSPIAFCCEPSWQQYRTLPDVCHGALNPLRGPVNYDDNFQPLTQSVELNSPLFTFNDRMSAVSYYIPNPEQRYLLASQMFTDPNDLNRVFGADKLTFDNFFVVFRYAHQAKRQVTKRFTLTFN